MITDDIFDFKMFFVYLGGISECSPIFSSLLIGFNALLRALLCSNV